MRKFLGYIFLCSIFLLLLFTVQVDARQRIICPLGKSEITIDGKWTTPDEWTDALVIEPGFLYGSGTVYLHLKHDHESLYVLLDYVSLKVPHSRDAAGLLVDTKNDGGDIMQTDDYFLIHIYLGGETTWLVRGWGTGEQIIDDFSDLNWEKIIQVDWELNPQGFTAVTTIEAINNPYTQENHVIWEFKIPKSEFKSDTISLIAYIIDFSGENGASYPQIEADKLGNPQYWVELTFSSKTLPEHTNQPSTHLSTSEQTSIILSQSEFISSSSIKTEEQKSTSVHISTTMTQEISIKTSIDSSNERVNTISLSIVVIIIFIGIIVLVYSVKRIRERHQKSISFCIICGKEIPSGSDFCPNCGVKQEFTLKR